MIHLYLGSKCNLNCTYCHREKEKDAVINEDFIKSLDGEFIVFKGGEPLVYMDTIKKIVSLAPNSRYQITTNGKDIEQHLDYLKGHNFHIAISCDFDNGCQRGYVPNFDLGIPLQIEAVLFHGNTDLLGMIDKADEIRTKYNLPYVTFYAHPIHFTNERNEKLCLTKDDCDNIAKQFKVILENKNEEKYFSMYRWITSLLRRNFSFGETRCTGNNIMRATVDGTKYNCLYVRNQKQNTLEDNQKFIRERFPECEHCKYYSICGSACIQSKAHDIECYYYRQLFKVLEEYERKRNC